MPQNPEHAYEQGPFEPVGNYAGRHLFGRYIPETDDGQHAEYHVEVHHDSVVELWAVVYLPQVDLPREEVGAGEEHLQRDALAYARELIDSGAQPSDEPYRRRGEGGRVKGQG